MSPYSTIYFVVYPIKNAAKQIIMTYEQCSCTLTVSLQAKHILPDKTELIQCKAIRITFYDPVLIFLS